MSGTGGRRGRRFINDKGRCVWRNSNSSHDRNQIQELKFYLRVTGPYRYMETFTKLKENIILKNQIEFMNVSDISE